MGPTEIYIVTRYEILQITILSEIFSSVTTLRINIALKSDNCTSSSGIPQNNKNISSAKTIIISRLYFHQEHEVELLDLKKAYFFL